MNKRSIPLVYMKLLILCVVSLFPSLVSACVGIGKDCTGFTSCCEPWVCTVTGSLTGPYKTCSCTRPNRACGNDNPGCCDGSPCGKDGKCPPAKRPGTGYSCPESVTVKGKSMAFDHKFILKHTLYCSFQRSDTTPCAYDITSGKLKNNKKDTPSPSYCPADVHYTCPTLKGLTNSSMNVYHDTNSFACWYKRPGEATSGSTGCTYSLTDGKLLHGLDECPPKVPR